MDIFSADEVTTFYSRIDHMLVDKKWSRSELAKRANIKKGTLNNMFINAKFHPRGDYLYSMAVALGVSVEYLMTGKERASVEDPVVTAILNVPQLRRIVEKLNTLPRNKLDAIEGVFMGFFNIANQNDQEFMAAEPSGKYG